MRIGRIIAAIFTVAALASCTQYKYESVKGDPMGTRIYTLDNGLKVYLSVNKEEPVIQTLIAVRSGGKNDPSDNTGLAHYLEHLMFKGTENFGTSDYAAEKVLLDQIADLYEVYRTKTDPAERKALYHQIDSISYEASKIAIPNEYDKLMAVIGSTGSNAFTGNDETCYMEDIPSNQVENWAKVQSDRFKNMVIRGFHTELEAVYEEYNMYLNADGENAMEAMDAVLFKNHPYGKQSIIGTQDHLKNPSIKTIIRHKATYYVPNNCAICVSGDLDPDSFIRIVDKYFGDWQPNPELPKFTYEPEAPITEPVQLTLSGTEAEFVTIAWRTPGNSSIESDCGTIVSSILANGSCGLIDIDINQAQSMLGAGIFDNNRADYGELILEGAPMGGQTLEEVKALLLAEVEKLRNGEFSEDLIESVKNNIKLREMNALTNNYLRAMEYVSSFINGNDWATDVQKSKRIEKISKDDVVAWANKYLSAESYVCVFKTTGINEKASHKIVAPAITPIVTNRDKQSEYLAAIQACEVKPIEPVFLDFSKDISRFECEGLDVIYKKNTLNDIAQVNFVFDEGTYSDPALDLAATYAEYLGSSTMSAEEIETELYSLACRGALHVNQEKSTLSISGLSENIGKALEIIEGRYRDAEADEDVLGALKMNELKGREDSKLSQRACYNAIRAYMIYGPEYIRKVTLTNKDLIGISSEELLSKIAGIFDKKHTVLYYGPASEKEVRAMLESAHKVKPELASAEKLHVTPLITSEPKVYVVNYDSRQFNYMQFSCRGEKLEPSDEAKIDLFNEYFGGGMNTVVFQEMREARALAYSAGAMLNAPSWAGGTYTFSASIGSQSDKLRQAVTAFDEIINNMPQTQKAFDIAKTSMITSLRTQRTTGMAAIMSYVRAKELGMDESNEKALFEAATELTMEDLVATQQKWVKDRTYSYCLLGDTSELDMKYLRTLGPVKILSLDEIFGY